MISDFIPQELQQKDLSALNEIVINANSIQESFDQEENSQQFAFITAKLSQTYGQDLALLNSVPSTLDEKNKICTIVIDYYKNILKLPDEKSSKLLRWLFSQQ
ncbi:MAG: hypothetical protein R3D86_13920 [Emcibacteraceae bacterium]